MKGLVILLIVLIIGAYLIEDSEGSQRPDYCENYPTLQTAKGSFDRAQKGWNSDKLKKNQSTIERVRIQSNCAESKKGRKVVKDNIDKAKKQFKRAKKNALYDDLINPPGAAYLASLRSCEAGGTYKTYPSGAYGWLGNSWQLTESRYNKTKWPEPSAPSPTSGSNDQQDIRAAILYQMYGSDPWPVCG